jgi:hypothetical protein
MHFINGIRQSPFPNGHWTDGLSQNEVIHTLISNGSALDYLKELTHESAQEDHFTAISRSVFLENDGRLDDYLKYDLGASMLLFLRLGEYSKEVISFEPKETGSLLRHWKDEGIIHADVLVEEAGKMDLNPAQIVEMEKLLNKIGRSLNITLPVVPEPTEEEKYQAIEHLTFADIQKHPRRYYDRFFNDMLVSGTPVTMNAKQFREYAEKVLKPS